MPSPKVPIIENPRRILALSAKTESLLLLLKDLTGETPQLIDGSVAGLSHVLKLRTAYYEADVPVWLDVLPEEGGAREWGDAFCEVEAGEVVRAVGAWVWVFEAGECEDDVRDVLRAIRRVILNADEGWEGTLLAVSVGKLVKGVEWEDLCAEEGFEFVDSKASGKDEYGEERGIARVRSALEVTAWDDDDDDDGGRFEEEGDGVRGVFAPETDEMERALGALGLRDEEAPGEVDEQDVAELEMLMARLQAAKDTAAGMPDAERRRFAARAVEGLLRDLEI
ncbi:hypothetical protein EJ06DRAFT_557804 [Trichodelitschia bisporula]|uniref:Alpha and gamma adaptin binding protein p34 n=1 Tax=Trichodelitschia bisporula TaxID=703511 RepID=A0A6G1HRL9_9PEZI|nr:hypothetical protein EJ06DRAFT_557804 [Trichodelitschia bisporula]